MKRSKADLIIIFAVAIAAIFSIAEQSFAEENKKLIMGWESWEPFAYRDIHGQLTGLDIELISHIMNKLGYTLDFKEVPWARLIRRVEDGKIHIGAQAMKTSERETYAYFSLPYQKETYVLFVRKGESSNYNLKSLEDIMGSSFRLGVMRDSLYGKEYNRLIRNPKFSEHVEAVPTDLQNHKKLLAKRIDGFIEEYSRMVIHGKQTGILDKVEPILVVEEINLHVMFSRKSTGSELVQAFNTELKKMKEDGAYHRLFQKYNLEAFNMMDK